MRRKRILKPFSMILHNNFPRAHHPSAPPTATRALLPPSRSTAPPSISSIRSQKLPISTRANPKSTAPGSVNRLVRNQHRHTLLRFAANTLLMSVRSIGGIYRVLQFTTPGADPTLFCEISEQRKEGSFPFSSFPGIIPRACSLEWAYLSTPNIGLKQCSSILLIFVRGSKQCRPELTIWTLAELHRLSDTPARNIGGSAEYGMGGGHLRPVLDILQGKGVAPFLALHSALLLFFIRLASNNCH